MGICITPCDDDEVRKVIEAMGAAPQLAERVYPVTLEMLRQSVVKGIGGFPDRHVTINFQVAEKDRVVTYWTGNGTHSGTWLGIDAKARKLDGMGSGFLVSPMVESLSTGYTLMRSVF